MGYVNNNLIKDENIIYKARMHWSIYLPSIALFTVGIIFVIGTDTPLGAGAILISFLMAMRAFIEKNTTELAITSKRVIAKFGLIRRSTIELNHSSVESYHIDQSIIGRLFDFGTIVINGTGGGKTPIPSIDCPLEFRKIAIETIDAA